MYLIFLNSHLLASECIFLYVLECPDCMLVFGLFNKDGNWMIVKKRKRNQWKKKNAAGEEKDQKGWIYFLLSSSWAFPLISLSFSSFP